MLQYLNTILSTHEFYFKQESGSYPYGN